MFFISLFIFEVPTVIIKDEVDPVRVNCSTLCLKIMKRLYDIVYCSHPIHTDGSYLKYFITRTLCIYFGHYVHLKCLKIE